MIRQLAPFAAFALLAPLASSQFGARTSLTGPMIANDMEFADLDHDGDLDLVAVDRTFGIRRVVTFENNGDGTFLAGVLLPSAPGSTFGNARKLDLADFDGDGETDVVATGDDTTSWWPGNGDGTFGVDRLVATTNPIAWDVHASDLNGDGLEDVVVISNSGSSVEVFLNQGGGMFAGPAFSLTGLDLAVNLAFGDLDGDNVLDLVVCELDGGTLDWFPGLGDGTFGPAGPAIANAEGTRDVHLVDADLDGDLDVFVTYIEHFVRLIYNNNGASFGPADEVTIFGQAYPGYLDVADFDYDGDPDVAVSFSNPERLVVFRNQGGGSFSGLTLNGPSDSADDVAFVDLDGDLDLDVVMATPYDQGIAAHFNGATVGSTYCTSHQNSTGAVGSLEVTGSNDVSIMQVALVASGLPLDSTGYFLTSQTQGSTNMPGGSQGILCLGGAVGRFAAPSEVRNSGAIGSIRLALDLDAIPQPMGRTSIDAGSTWNFQAWHRDVVGGAATSNFTDAVSVAF